LSTPLARSSPLANVIVFSKRGGRRAAVRESRCRSAPPVRRSYLHRPAPYDQMLTRSLAAQASDTPAVTICTRCGHDDLARARGTPPLRRLVTKRQFLGTQKTS